MRTAGWQPDRIHCRPALRQAHRLRITIASERLTELFGIILPLMPFRRPSSTPLRSEAAAPVAVDVREIRGRRIGRCGRVSRSRGFGGSGRSRRLGGRRNGGLLQCKRERIEHQILRHVLGRTGTQRIGITADHQLAVGEAVVHQHAEGGGAPVEGEPLRLVSVVLAVRKVCLYLVVGLGQLGLAGVGQVDLNGFCTVLGGCLGEAKSARSNCHSSFRKSVTLHRRRSPRRAAQ